MLPPVANDFVAGETMPAALERARRLNERGVGGILNLLGEHYDEPEPAVADAETYCRLVADIGRSDLDCTISVKPSQLGLDVGEALFRDTLDRVVEAAAEAGVFVWIDMEDYHTTDATLDAFADLTTEYDGATASEASGGSSEPRSDGGTASEASGGSSEPRSDGGVGVCVQANLKRTPADLERLADLPGKVRLVKGAYAPPREVAYRDDERIDAAYEDCLRRMFATFETGIAVGSHDPAMLALADQLHAKHGTPFEIQMLMGVREPAQFDLAADHTVYQYVPFGGQWLSYFYRRVRERRGNLLFAARAVLS